MADFRIIGFETGDNSEAWSSAGTFSIQTTTKRSGSYALRVNPVTASLGWTAYTGFNTNGVMDAAAVNSADMVLRFYFRYATLPGVSVEFFAGLNTTNNGTRKCGFGISSTGTISILGSNDSTIIATGTTALSANTWYLIEIYIGTAAASPYTIKINGVTELTGTSSSITNANNGVLILGKIVNRTSQTVDFYYDDLRWASGSTFLGAGQVIIAVPNANGNYQGFTIGAGSGSHYQIVNEIPPNGDTSYLTGGGTVAETEALQDSSTLGLHSYDTINSVQQFTISRNASGVSSIAPAQRLRSNTTNSDTGSINKTNTYEMRGQIFSTDPATSSAWTTSGIDGIESGVVNVSGSASLNLTMVGAMIDYTPGSPPPASSNSFFLV